MAPTCKMRHPFLAAIVLLLSCVCVGPDRNRRTTKGFALEDAGGRVGGHVVLPPGTNLEQAHFVVLSSADGENLGRCRIDAAGGFVIAVGQASHLNVRVDIESQTLFLYSPLVVSLGEPSAVVLRPMLGGSLLLRFSPGGSTTGMNPREIIGEECNLSYLGPFSRRQISTALYIGEDLCLATGALFPTETYTFYSELGPFAPLELSDLSIAPGEIRSIDVQLTGGLYISGHVRDANGRALHGAEVLVRWPRGRQGHSTGRYATTDERGFFSLPALSPALSEVVVWMDGYRVVRILREELGDLGNLSVTLESD